jgi:putative ABC transport system permease protein
MLYLRVFLIRKTLVATLRMTFQLLFVGFYLRYLFDFNYWWLNLLWLMVMVLVADMSIINNTDVSPRRFVVPVFIAVLVGTTVPLFYIMAMITGPAGVLDARYMVPISGMIMGNCLRSNVVGLTIFYRSIETGERDYQRRLAAGASRGEAVRPHFQEAFESALAPTIATMATIGLVSLPGMMTGIILGGGDPMTAIRYQIAIMIAILVGTALTVWLAVYLSLNTGFTSYGVVDRSIFIRTNKK